MANYLTVGHMEDGILVELSPKRRARVSEAGTGREISAEEPRALPSINETIAYYQVAATFLRGR
jgi:hypothetical protein